MFCPKAWVHFDSRAKSMVKIKLGKEKPEAYKLKSFYYEDLSISCLILTTLC